MGKDLMVHAFGEGKGQGSCGLMHHANRRRKLSLTRQARPNLVEHIAIKIRFHSLYKPRRAFYPLFPWHSTSNHSGNQISVIFNIYLSSTQPHFVTCTVTIFSQTPWPQQLPHCSPKQPCTPALLHTAARDNLLRIGVIQAAQVSYCFTSECSDKLHGCTIFFWLR